MIRERLSHVSVNKPNYFYTNQGAYMSIEKENFDDDENCIDAVGVQDIECGVIVVTKVFVRCSKGK